MKFEVLRIEYGTKRTPDYHTISEGIFEAIGPCEAWMLFAKKYGFPYIAAHVDANSFSAYLTTFLDGNEFFTILPDYMWNSYDFYIKDLIERRKVFQNSKAHKSVAQSTPQPQTKKQIDTSSIDPVTSRLMASALKTHGKDTCPKCNEIGKFIRMSLVCSKHGPFGGI